MHGCVVKYTEKCDDPTPSNILDSLITQMLKVTPCLQTSSAPSTGILHLLPHLLTLMAAALMAANILLWFFSLHCSLGRCPALHSVHLSLPTSYTDPLDYNAPRQASYITLMADLILLWSVSFHCSLRSCPALQLNVATWYLCWQRDYTQQELKNVLCKLMRCVDGPKAWLL